MRFVVLDFESYFDKDYTFSKLGTEEYTRDPRFEAHGAAIKFAPDLPARWWSRDELPALFAEIDWSDVFLISHHAQWDHLALSHWYGVRPRWSGCTLSMARLMLGNHISVSLESVRKEFGIPPKTTPYNLFIGKHWHEMDARTQELVAAGACDEVESISTIFGALLKRGFPLEELAVIDTIIKMHSQPVLGADMAILRDIWKNEAVKKRDAMATLGVVKAELQSADKFAELLRQAGVEPETKTSPKGNDIWAFAKTDAFMQDLLEHWDDRVRLLAEARIGAKSTLMQTRAATYGRMARRGPLCVYLRYAGTGTLRPAGGDGSNFLNLKRKDPDSPRQASPIRRAILAPEGFLLGPVDSSQIELRVCMYLAGQQDVLDVLRAGGDPYVDLASQFYGEPIYKPKKDDPRAKEMEQKRGAGKQGCLLCIYGAAAVQFQKTARAGLYGPPIDMTIEEAERFVTITRQSMPALCAPRTGYWATANRMLARLAGGEPCQWGPLEVRDKRLYLPNGCPIIYDTLEYHVPDEEEREKLKPHEWDGFWRLRTCQGWKKMWGQKLVQNVCEAASRVIVSQAMIRITAMGYRVLNWPYDELLCLIPKDGKEQWHLDRCLAEMKKTPDWLPGIPLDAEGSLSDRYEK